MKEIKLISFIYLFTFVFTTANAQTFFGKITDAADTPIAFANVVLLQTTDSAFVAGNVTDSLGNFSFNVKKDKYLLRVSFVGFLPHSQIAENQNIGTIILENDTATLQEIVVTATRPIIKMEGRGISVDVQNSRLKAMGNAAEVLGQIPMVTKNGTNIEVFGKGKPLIFVNNRQLRDVSELEQINSDMIKKITVITNPSSEYPADVKSVIKIETLKIQGDGLSGNIVLVGDTKQFQDFAQYERINLNYRMGKTDIFGMFVYGYSNQSLGYNSSIKYDADNKIEISEKGTVIYYYPASFAVRTGINHTFDENNAAGVRYDYTDDLTYYQKIGHTEMVVHKNGVLNDSLVSENNTTSNSAKHLINAYYNGKIAARLLVNLNIDFAAGKTIDNQNVDNKNTVNIGSADTLRTKSEQNYQLFASKLVFTTPLKDDNLSYGGEFSLTTNHQVFNILEQITENNILQPDKSNVKQNLFAIFLNYSKTIADFVLDAGLRYEYVKVDYFSNEILQKSQSPNYSNWFPNLNFSYSKNKLALALGYNRSIDRPSYWNLRNSYMYDSPFWYETGNPLLQPTIDNNVTSSVQWKDLLFSASYDVYQNPSFLITSIYRNDILLSKTENLEKCTRLSFFASYSPTVKFWKPSLELAYTQGFLKYDNQNFNQPVFSAKVKNNFSFANKLQFGLDCSYFSCGNSEIMKYVYDKFRADFYLSKSFLADKIRLNFYIYDAFDTDRNKSSSNINKIETAGKNDLMCNPRFRITAGYYFNQTRSKYKGEKATDELNRL
ncbi:hypothetical protein FACS189429_7250 [Bacteroidia bacterium]|nr:hypothetical protein FACS189429_7250 [Bacteroidia bacterium]